MSVMHSRIVSMALAVTLFFMLFCGVCPIGLAQGDPAPTVPVPTVETVNGFAVAEAEDMKWPVKEDGVTPIDGIELVDIDSKDPLRGKRLKLNLLRTEKDDWEYNVEAVPDMEFQFIPDVPGKYTVYLLVNPTTENKSVWVMQPDGVKWAQVGLGAPKGLYRWRPVRTYPDTESGTVLEAGAVTNVKVMACNGYFSVDKVCIAREGSFKPVENIEVAAEDGISTIIAGESLQMTAAVSPADTTWPDVTWSVTAGDGISANIDSNGLLTTADTDSGEVTVRATSQDGAYIYGEKTILILNADIPQPVTGITVDGEGGSDSVAVGGTLQMVAAVMPEYAGNKTVTWSILDPEAHPGITISEAGLLAAGPEEGNVTVRATANDGSGIYGEKEIAIVSIAANYSANGGTGTAPEEVHINPGETFPAAENPFSHAEGMVFKGWNTNADGSGTGYQPGDTVVMPEQNLTLYAIWVYPSPYEPYRNTSFRADRIGVHPRIILNSEISMEELYRRKTATAYQPFYDLLLESADKWPLDADWITEGMNGQEMEWKIPDVALAYFYTGEEAYRTRIRSWVLKMIEIPQWDSNNGMDISHAGGLMGVSLAYDWCYDLFTESERAQIREKLMAEARKLYNHFQEFNYFTADYVNNHGHIRMAGLMLTALALMGEGYDDEVTAYYNFCEEHLRKTLEWMPPDGSTHEGPSYGVYGAYRIAMLLTAYEGITGIDLWGDLMKNTAEFKAYTYTPGLTNLVPWADYGSGTYYFNHFFFKIASKFRDSQLQQLMLDAYQAAPDSFVYPSWLMIYYDDSLEPEEWKAPGYDYFSDIEMANFRTGWGADDISLTFKCGPPGGHILNDYRDTRTGYESDYVNIGHSKPDAQNIFISFAGKRWGDYPPYIKPGAPVPTRLTRYHNTLLVDGKGQKFEVAEGWAKVANMSDDQAYIGEYFGTDGYGFAAGDAHKAYDGLDKFTRDIFFIDGRYYVSFDDVAKAEGIGTFEYLFHNKGEWTGDLENGYVIAQDSDSMELHVKMPVPAVANLAPPSTDSQLSRLGSELSVKNEQAEEAADFMAVYFPRLNGESLPAAPILTADDEGYMLQVERNGSKTDIVKTRGDKGTITAPDIISFAKSMFYTKNGDEIANSVMVDGTSLTLPEGYPSFLSSTAANLRYEKLASGFRVWIAKPLKTDGQDITLTIAGLQPDTEYTIKRVQEAHENVFSNGSGQLGITLNKDELEEDTDAGSESKVVSFEVTEAHPVSRMPLLDMTFALEGISLSGSSGIIGNAGTNAVEAGSIDFGWSTGIKGDLWTGPAVDWTEIIKSARPDPQENVTGKIAALPSAREYPLPQFPVFPDLENKGDLNVGWWPEDPYMIGESGAYDNICVTNLLTIDVGDEDIEIVTDNLSVTGNGCITVNRTGTGRVVLYVANRLELAGSGKINPNGGHDDVFLYYAGDETLEFGGSTIFNGSIFAGKANAALGGSGNLTGYIVTGGNAVDISGNAEANAVIYAPNAAFTVSGSGKMQGTPIVRSMKLSGSVRIQYEDMKNSDFLKKLDW